MRPASFFLLAHCIRASQFGKDDITTCCSAESESFHSSALREKPQKSVNSIILSPFSAARRHKQREEEKLPKKFRSTIKCRPERGPRRGKKKLIEPSELIFIFSNCSLKTEAAIIATESLARRKSIAMQPGLHVKVFFFYWISAELSRLEGSPGSSGSIAGC